SATSRRSEGLRGSVLRLVFRQREYLSGKHPSQAVYPNAELFDMPKELIEFGAGLRVALSVIDAVAQVSERSEQRPVVLAFVEHPEVEEEIRLIAQEHRVNRLRV